MSLAVSMLFGLLVVILPFISFSVWALLFMSLFPYSRKTFPLSIFLKEWGATAKFISLGLIPLFLLASSMISAGISIVLELGFALVASMVFAGDTNITLMTVLMSAGPIEESAKLLCAALIYMTVFLIWKKRPQMAKRRNRVKDGLIIGLLAGASFGLLESILYMFSGFNTLISRPLTLSTIDPLIWRFTLGVSLHAVYTGLASAGLGRSTLMKKVAFTSIFLSAATILHSLNNGIQGYFTLYSDIEGITQIIITDIIQFGLAASAVVLFIVLWKTSGPDQGENGN